MILRNCVAFALLLFAAPAAAHITEEPVRPTNLWSSWGFDPFIWVPLLLFGLLYALGVVRLWARAGSGRAIARWQVLACVAGCFALFVALLSPLDPLSDTLLSAHMVQHMLLVAIAPPLLLLAAPATALTWALPLRARRWFQRPSWHGVAAAFSSLSHPVPATILHAIAFWGWHAPPAFHAALEREWVHTAEHLSFLVTALFFWQAVLASGRRPALRPLGALAAFITFLHGGLLGGLLSLAPVPLYDSYVGRSEAWGLTALTDQQLAGIIMWVPIGPVYLAAVLMLLWPMLADKGSIRVADRREEASRP
jgi:putative membrane protein